MRIKLVFLIAFTTMLQVSASSFGQKININQANITLEKALKLIRQQSGYDALFDAKLIQKSGSLNLTLKNASIDEALKQCLTGTNLSYTIEENTILIKERSFVEELKQRITDQFVENKVGGFVYDKNSIPLIGATVMVKRTKKAVYSNNKGYFFISEVLPTDSLVFSYIGYVPQTVVVGRERTFLITLKESTNSLDAVMVQGYGKTTQRLATGNISRVTAADIEKQLIANPIMALQGAVAGLEIKQISGSDSDMQKVEIRGRKSINSNFGSEPLYVIDGVPLTVLGKTNGISTNRQTSISSGFDLFNGSHQTGINPLYSLNPNEIESIEVLKDADATAIYGSRAGNGVILITTKKGKPGKSTFSVNAKQGVKVVADRWEMTNTAQYLDYRRAAFKNDGITPTVNNAKELMVYDQNRYTDWQEYAWGNKGKWTNFDASLSGGDAQTTFRLSSAINRTTDVSQISGVNQRISAGSNISHRALNQRLSIDFSANYSATENNAMSITPSIAFLAPNSPAVFNDSGNLNFDAWQTNMNDFAAFEKSTKVNSNFLNTSLNINFNVTDNLSIKLNAGYNNSISDFNSRSPLSAVNMTLNPQAIPSAVNSISRINNLIVEPQLEYKAIIGKGRFSALLGGTYQDNSTKGLNISSEGYVSDDQMESVNNAKVFRITELQRLYRYLGVFARLNYNWENKYILNLNGRRDGSSRFGPANRFGNFGSVGAAWIATEESWLRKKLPKVISFAKLRASYGVTGSDGVGDYQYISQWARKSNGSEMDLYDGVAPLLPQIQPNEDFHWQQNEMLDLALELAFFKDAINLGVTYYSNYTDNQLTNFPIANFTGFSSVTLNSPAQVRNSGVELNFSAKLVQTKNISWNMGLNLSKNKNILVGYPNIEDSPYYVHYRIGSSLNNIYTFKYTGLDPQTGEYTFLDYNGDGKINTDVSVPAGTGADDRFVEINTSPELTGGMSHSFRYKNFGLSLNFNYVKQLGKYVNDFNNGNISLYKYENTWRNPGDNAVFSKFTTQNKLSNGQYSLSDGEYSRADFLRLSAAQFSYAIHGNVLKSIGISSLSLNVTAQNLFVITNYQGLDPETQIFGGVPISRVITMGLNCSF
ncbi:SusC/RagA family TonB-linked outer membrane protein [Pedobacter sp. ASV1-7]|uniref:SusC/RagA family TonB-linked outer membrane protein n=1 Tax=Pedobacter sp. ASV1-7 TaxID=3145237 RepID=UPI0032E853F3